MPQEPLGQTWWGVSSFPSLSVLLLLFKVKSWGKCPACVCHCFVSGMCAEWVGRQGPPCRWWRRAGCGRRWGGEAGSRHWMWGLGGAARISLSQTAALSASAVVPQGPHGDSGQATPMAQLGLTCQCGNLSSQDCGPRLGCSQGESTREASLIALAHPPTTCGSGQGVAICERHVQPSCWLEAGTVISGPQAQMVLLRGDPERSLEQTRLSHSPLGPPGLAPSGTLPLVPFKTPPSFKNPIPRLTWAFPFLLPHSDLREMWTTLTPPRSGQ